MRCIAPLLKLLLLVFVLAMSGTTRADEIFVRDANLRATDEGLVLNAEFSFQITPRLTEAVENGVPLYFELEFELTRSRWYWFDEKAVAKRMQVRLSYHALSRQYRLSTGLLQQSFGTLEEALDVLRQLRNWLVVDRTVALADANYEAAVRMRLDTTLLPKPFQLSALTNREWNLESAWKRFSFRPPQQPPAPVESRQPTEAPAR
ncbi:MAG TPA: DUF4390 domain-containing protein [Burkholderiales bacterium]|nr:DUF4390 domain-containing protein [Burkholderiales bacterium]